MLWAPSPFADAASRELPAEMEQEQIDAVVAGFAEAARRTVRAGLDGVELDAGVFALLRQFHSGLTNQRQDGYGTDRLRLTREVVAAVREVIGAGRVLALRLSCDELAPWAGVTPEQAADQVAELADVTDLLVVVRGGPFATSAYRPDAHTEPQFNLELCRAMREAAGGRVPVVLQGSVTEVPAARAALEAGAADLVEMTRAQIAEPLLVELVRAGTPERVRPCVLCNQACQVRDNRNPVVSCIGEPCSGHETEPEHAPTPPQGQVFRPCWLSVAARPGWSAPGCSRPWGTESVSRSGPSARAACCAPRRWAARLGNGLPSWPTGFRTSAFGSARGSSPTRRSDRLSWRMPRTGVSGWCSPLAHVPHRVPGPLAGRRTRRSPSP